jgi:hypothetical protein
VIDARFEKYDVDGASSRMGGWKGEGLMEMQRRGRRRSTTLSSMRRSASRARARRPCACTLQSSALRCCSCVISGRPGVPVPCFLSSPAAILSAGAAARTHETRRIRQIAAMTDRASCYEGPPRPASVPAETVLTSAASLWCV